MKKLGPILCLLTIVAGTAVAQSNSQDSGLPTLHDIHTIKLSPSYSCRTPEQFSTGYAQTALFLSAYAKQRNSPDLLFNGACRADDEFQAALAGDSFSLIADLGADVSLADVSAARAFNLKRVHDYADYSKFAQNVKVIANHTYAVLLNDSDKRGLFIFQVVAHVPNESVELRYVVKSYQITTSHGLASAGFDWDRISR